MHHNLLPGVQNVLLLDIHHIGIYIAHVLSGYNVPHTSKYLNRSQ